MNPLALTPGSNLRNKFVASRATPISNIPAGQTLNMGTQPSVGPAGGTSALAPKIAPAVKTPAAQKYISSVYSPQVSANQPSAVQQQPAQAQGGNFTTPSGASVGANGSLVQAPAVDPKDAYKTAFSDYIKTLSPSDEENVATKNLSDLTLQQKKDQEAALDRGDTLGFASGLAEKVNRNNAFQIEAATNAVNAFTNRRASMNDAQKARVDFEKSLLGDSKSSIEKVGNDIVRIGPDGKATKIYTGAPDQKTQVIQANGRSVLIDSNTGKPLADLGASEGALSRAAVAARAGSGGGGTLKESATERGALGYYLRGKDALDTAAGIEDSIVNKSLGGQAWLEWAPNMLQTEENQVYRQLQRQFTEARLRKESGAAIPPNEYAQDAQTYFAAPGDSKTVLARKNAARNVVLQSLQIGAGNAYRNYSSGAPVNSGAEVDPEYAEYMRAIGTVN